MRRQEKRKAARTKSAAEATQSPEGTAKVQETETNTYAEKVIVSKTDDNLKKSEQPSAEEVQSCFRCETCNFRSETITMRREESTNNLAQQILNVEQIDGNM